MLLHTKIAATNADGNAFFYASDMSYDNSGHVNAGFVGIATAPDVFSFGIINEVDGKVALGVAGEGRMVLNMDMDDDPIAQVDIRPLGGGEENILNIGNGSNPPLLMVKNLSPGGVGIGIDPPFGTLALKGTSGTALDMWATASEGYNMQIRMIDGEHIRHIITDDPSSGVDALLIVPGYDGTSNHRVKIMGDLETTGNAKIGGTADIVGRVKIGDVTIPNSDYMLYVEKGILAERYKCALKSDNTNWSDYVFAKDYKLMSISALEKYVNKNHHLPNIPSAEQVYKDGIDLADMDAKLLEKIEELSLYVIQLQKQIRQLEKK